MTEVFTCRQSEDAPKTKLGFDNVNVVIPGRCLLMMVMVILMGIGDCFKFQLNSDQIQPDPETRWRHPVQEGQVN